MGSSWNKSVGGVYGGNVEGKEPSLKHNIFSELKEAGLRLESHQAEPSRTQKGRETRDKNNGRKVVPLPFKEKQEDQDIMAQPNMHESLESKIHTPTADQRMETVGQALEANIAIVARETHALRRQFEQQNTLQSRAINFGVTALAVGVGVGLAMGGYALITNNGSPELPPGKPSK